MWDIEMEKNLHNWVSYIGNQSIPIINKTVQSVLSLSLDEKSTCKQLANTIIKDVALTTRVLRVANSPYYKRCNNDITDLRRIILLIGFKRISEICLTLSILDTTVDKKTRKYVHSVATRSFHAAIQARSIAQLYKLKETDTIYMSTLLYNIGEIAFWSLTGKSGLLISDLLKQAGRDNEQAEKEILGTTFRELSYGLISEWKLYDLLKRALSNPTSSELNIKCITYGYMIADSINDNNLDYYFLAEEIAKDSKSSATEVKNTIIENIKISNDTYNYYQK